MRIITVLTALAAFVLISPTATAQVTSDELEQRDGLYYRTGQPAPFTGLVENPGESRGNVENGERVGEWTWWYPDGQRALLISYDDGTPLNQTRWHENGQVSSRTTYDDEGRITGLMQHWDVNGTLRDAHEWEAGMEHGEARQYDHNGNLLRTAYYVDDKKHGTETWWYTDGTKRWEIHFDEGARTGTWTQYDPDGQVQMQSVWADGKLISRNSPHAGH